MSVCRALSIAMLMTVAAGWLPPAVRVCSAEDGIGCLVCHQYPGLVIREAPDRLRVLHVDQDKFLRSAHGKLGCRSCHTNIEQVPHTGADEINCTNGCHQGDAEKIARYPLADFHKEEQSLLVDVGRKTACEVCHSIHPHSESPVTRAFLNLHAGFMFCDVCHTVQQQRDHSLCYDWENAEDAEFRGEPFGSYYNPKERRIQEPARFISRIAVFALKDREKYSLRDDRDIPKAMDFLRKEKSLGRSERRSRLAYFHRGVKKRKPGAACDGCHSPHGILDFAALGFDKKETDYLAHLNIKALVTKYRTFHFPDLFGHFASECSPAREK
jgi:hypothetical protein